MWRCVLITLLLLASGCVERELVVASEPEGTEVFVDGVLAGTTAKGQPVRVPFDFYGTRQVTGRCAGYRPVRRDVELCVPWYQVIPLGLVTDLLWPGTIRDEHHVTLRLERRGEAPPAAEVAEQAQDFERREGTQ
ncbi:MAG TPA: hypothetical protein DEA08_30220 [Planctomycetes bacterium]|nr:hypothetical protein [Planctomycetota bacterium]